MFFSSFGSDRNSTDSLYYSRPLCDLTGDWLFVAEFAGMEFPYTVSIVQTGRLITGNGISSSPLQQSDTLQIVKGILTGNRLKLIIVFNSGGYTGVEYNDGVIDCILGSMIGTWTHIGGYGLHGTWSASRVP